jgi:hypothetical protein
MPSTCELPGSDRVGPVCQGPARLSAYIAFHRLQVRQLQSGKGGRFLVVHCQKAGCGGIGDRLKKLAVTLDVAMATRRALLINFTHPDPLEVLFRGNVVEWSASRLEPALAGLPSWTFSSLPAESLTSFPPDLNDVAAAVVHAHIKEAGGSAAVRVRLRELVPPGMDIGCWFHLFFAPTPALCSAIAQSLPQTRAFGSQRTQDADGAATAPRYVALHVRSRDSTFRRGARATPPHTRPPPQARPLGIDCAERLRRERDVAALLVISNDATALRSVTAEAALHGRPWWVPSQPAEALHKSSGVTRDGVLPTSRPLCHSDDAKRDSSCSDVAAGHTASWSDFFLVAGADAVVIPRSGFAATAASVGLLHPQSRRRMAESCSRCTADCYWCVTRTWNYHVRPNCTMPP